MKCLVCKSDFKPTRITQKFCSLKCQRVDYNKRRRDARPKPKLLKKKCCHCDACFEHDTTRPTQKYCGFKCKQNVLNSKYYFKNKEKYKLRKENYYNKNKHLYTANSAKRRAVKKMATLKGYDQEIKLIYKNCPEKHHVDHVVPLQGKNVCGLHVPWNLQYLTVEENLKKSNKLLLY